MVQLGQFPQSPGEMARVCWRTVRVRDGFYLFIPARALNDFAQEVFSTPAEYETAANYDRRFVHFLRALFAFEFCASIDALRIRLVLLRVKTIPGSIEYVIS